MLTTIKEIYQDVNKYLNQEITLKGWIRTNRDQKEYGFINLSDGSYFETIQLVYEKETTKNFENISKYSVGSSISVKGYLELTPDRKQPFELKVLESDLLGDADETYPIQPKRHSREFLREVSHLRVRTNLFQAVFRVRSIAAFAI